MSQTQRHLAKDLMGSVISGEISRLYLRRRNLNAQAIHRGINAERILHFVMEAECVEECVGDALERLDEFQERYGTVYAVWHYRWTILCLFFHAVWRKNPVAKVLSALLMKIENK